MDALKLEYELKKKGITTEQIAHILNMDKATFYRKKKGISDFTRMEIQTIKETLDLSIEEVDAIFFV